MEKEGSGRDVWVVHTEDVDNNEIKIFGVFKNLKRAIKTVREHLIQEDLDSDYGYEGWWENEYDGPIDNLEDAKKDLELRKEYLDWTERRIDKRIRKWQRYLDQPRPKRLKERQELAKKQKGFQWGVHDYVFSKSKEY